jgi:uncharacterized protein (DUF2147 family)
MSVPRMLGVVLLAFSALPAVWGQNQNEEADRILGVWRTEEGKARVEITRCGEQFCGTIIWLKEPVKNGKEVLDDKNPDPKLREKPVLGMKLMWNFSYDGDGEYSGGEIYDAESGNTYKGKMTFADEKTLDLRGYVLIPLFGRTSRWTRYEGKP